MTSPWLVPVTSLRRHPGSRREEQRVGPVGELGDLRVAGSLVPAGASASAVAVLDAVLGGGVEVTASVVAPWEGECRRCLRPLRGELRCQVRELYRARSADSGGDGRAAGRGEGRGEGRGDGRVASRADADDDEDTYPLTGDHLDLRPLVRDALLLELPLAPLCRPDCQGLCPVCGVDRNEASCDCAGAQRDPRWGALDALVEKGDLGSG